MKNLTLRFLLPLVLSLALAGAALAQKGANIEDQAVADPAVTALAAPTPLPQGAAAQDSPAEDAHFDFMRNALCAGVLVALLCSYLGLFVVARRMVFIGVALSEMSSAGIALGVLLGFKPLLGALAFMLLGVLLFSRRWAARRLPEDAPVGIFYVLSIALGILLIAQSPHGETEMLKLMQGDVLTVDPMENLEMGGVFAVLALVHILFAKEFLLVSLDRDMASTLGFNARRWDFLLFLTIGIAVTLGIRATGVLMTATMLIVPAATALLLVQRWRAASVVAPCLGLLAVASGLWISMHTNFPPSALIVAIAVALLAPVLAFNGVARRG